MSGPRPPRKAQTEAEKLEDAMWNDKNESILAGIRVFHKIELRLRTEDYRRLQSTLATLQGKPSCEEVSKIRGQCCAILSGEPDLLKDFEAFFSEYIEPKIVTLPPVSTQNPSASLLGGTSSSDSASGSGS